MLARAARANGVQLPAPGPSQPSSAVALVAETLDLLQGINDAINRGGSEALEHRTNKVALARLEKLLPRVVDGLSGEKPGRALDVPAQVELAKATLIDRGVDIANSPIAFLLPHADRIRTSVTEPKRGGEFQFPPQGK